ncbi:MAG: alpha-glucan family phosphorylase [Alphaproteobacteria bacterium]|nr:alpha-glucan family phosphorylase [Alphaproteobacteria bacterium]
MRHAVAYFCMEFGLDVRLPIYAGGLGVLAGDILKAAHDQDRDLVGIGILWSEGYTTQILDEHGVPQDAYTPIPRAALRPTGVQCNVRIRGERVPITAWRCDAYGNAPLYLIEPIRTEDRWMSRHLYGGDSDDRVVQEILLGVGGVRVLRELGLDVALYHFNEGHALFAGVELVRRLVDDDGMTWEDALAATRRRCIFTTHTPVPAGNEVHPIDRLVANGMVCGTVTAERLVRLGGSPFEMTPAALRLSSQANAVAELHGETARRMWRHVPDAAPIASITNGVHLGTWQDRTLATLHASGASDDDLWARHQELKRTLIGEIARRNGVHLDPDVLLIGFARRAATYKRASLVLRDLEWLTPLLDKNAFAIVFSGKAHPRDMGGKALIHEIASIARRHPKHVVFLDNYDMNLGGLLTRGADIWLNNPRRPLEASGTSGMKAAANGILNVSILDGWWDEGCEDEVNGWQFGDRLDAHNDHDDARDLHALQQVLTEKVLPTYYDDRKRWVDMMRHAIDTAETKFSAGVMLDGYYDRMYGPALSDLGLPPARRGDTTAR